MNCQSVKNQIVSWMKAKAVAANARGFVVGVSGGVDSALVSMLCALTGMKTILVQMPINRKDSDIPVRSNNHCKMLASNFENVSVFTHDMSIPYNQFLSSMNFIGKSDLAKANLSSRFRMCSLYMFSNEYHCLVAGTGNKVEDFGVGFFTKYGDGGVDISPIGDLLKSEVRELAAFLGVSPEIVSAIPTDELWSDTRSDETAIGATYDELEFAMKIYQEWENRNHCNSFDTSLENYTLYLDARQREVLKIFVARHNSNAHKMAMPPICEVLKN